MHAPTDAADALPVPAVVIGAGPIGLFQVFQLGLLEIAAHVIDALPHPGGQPVELYPDKPIYDIPGTLMCTGRGLVDALMAQCAPFKPTFHLGQEVSQVERQPDGRFLVATGQGTRLLATTVFIAAGVGAFQPRALKVPGAQAFEGRDFFYRLADASAHAGRQVVVNGGEDAALDAVLALAAQPEGRRPARITLLHRRDVFQGQAGQVDALRALQAQGRIAVHIGQVAGFEAAAGGRLAALQIAEPDGGTQRLPADLLLGFYGVSPRLGPVAQWGLDIERKQLKVDTEQFSTSERGIFAVGDVNTYPGKKKLIVSGFHECALAAFGAAAIVFPGQPVHLQYTTTSPRLHALLGVATPGKA